MTADIERKDFTALVDLMLAYLEEANIKAERDEVEDTLTRVFCVEN